MDDDFVPAKRARMSFSKQKEDPEAMDVADSSTNPEDEVIVIDDSSESGDSEEHEDSLADSNSGSDANFSEGEESDVYTDAEEPEPEYDSPDYQDTDDDDSEQDREDEDHGRRQEMQYLLKRINRIKSSLREAKRQSVPAQENMEQDELNLNLQERKDRYNSDADRGPPSSE